MIKKKIKTLFGNQAKPSPRALKKDNFLFVHIPKTAGTSFRDALEYDYNVVSDYGIDSLKTTSELKEKIYVEHNMYSLKKMLERNQTCWLCGHVPLQRYIDFVPVLNIVSFVRSPLKQLLSHYNHFVSYNDFKGDLNDFLKMSGVLNVQHRALSFLPLGLLGCVGITEEYDDSLRIINHNMKTAILPAELNVNRSKTLDELDLNEELKSLVLSKIDLDVQLYNEAYFVHKQSLEQLEQKKQQVRAYAYVNVSNVLHGCAYFVEKQDAVTLIVYVNNKEIKQITANEYFSLYTKANFPRDRYIGFRLLLSDDITMNDEIDLYVKDTGQKINYKPLNVTS
jgi:hypothetical protein